MRCYIAYIIYNPTASWENDATYREIPFAEHVEGDTPEEALKAGLEELRETLQEVVGLYTLEAPIFEEAVNTFLGGDWEQTDIGFRKQIHKYNDDCRTRWSVLLSDGGKGIWFDDVATPEQKASLFQILKEAA